MEQIIVNNRENKYYNNMVDLYDHAFPKDECYPVEDLETLIGGSAVAYAYEDCGQFVGGVYFVMDSININLMFLAITEEMRGKGYGSRILTTFKETYPKHKISLLIETLQMPADNIEQRKNRESFYIKNGFSYSEISTKEPSGVFDLLVWNGKVTFDEMQEFFQDVIGREFLRKWRVRIVPGRHKESQLTPYDATILAGISLKNRIIRSATSEGRADENGFPTEAQTVMYENMARGGVGCIITGAVGIQEDGKNARSPMLMLDSDDKIEPLKELVNRVHALDTPIIVQISHAGMYSKNGFKEPDTKEVEAIVNNFAEASLRARKAGFDGVQLQMAHGEFLSGLLSPALNKRKDKYGGSTENRCRASSEIIQKIREKNGSYPIFAKINSYERPKKGIRTEEAVKIAVLLEKAGIDAIEVSSGLMNDGFITVRGEYPVEMVAATNNVLNNVPEQLIQIVKPKVKKYFGSPGPYRLYNLKNATAVKAAVSIPVICVGGIRTVGDINRVFQNDIEYAAMARPFIAEPDIVNRFKQKKQPISYCKNCSYCVLLPYDMPTQCVHGKIPEEVEKTNIRKRRHFS